MGGKLAKHSNQATFIHNLTLSNFKGKTMIPFLSTAAYQAAKIIINTLVAIFLGGLLALALVLVQEALDPKVRLAAGFHLARGTRWVRRPHSRYCCRPAWGFSPAR